MSIKCISFNILHGGELGNGVFDFLQSQNADILMLQEVYDGHDPHSPQNFRTMEILHGLFPSYYSYFSPELLHKTKLATAEIGNAVFTKFPIIQKRTEFFDTPYGTYGEIREDNDYSDDPKNMQLATLNIEGKDVLVCNLHGIWGFNGDDNERRINMSEKIISAVKDNERVIVAGDFNTQPHTRTIQAIEAHLTNVFKDELTTTFNMKAKKSGGYATAVVDMMFISRSLQIVNHECPQVEVSDHLPLVVELEV